ncbi:HK97 family phage prohead protease [Thauera sp.]|uniref:HK97 family phage prohead protease n=1 Tax=Thauera sp. TaxID=1905334 RepID=UPI002B7BDCDA|nr:HK97 family phage prohead protease [Thauera sp.]HRP23612.1 HK97 family phage prohead protease [Thauera sp.]
MTPPDIERRGAAGGLRASGRVLSGYAAVFGQETRIGGFTERIKPGAFSKSLASGRDILALMDHRADALLGRTKSGTLKLYEDDKGLAFELRLPDTQAGRDLVALAERGDVGGMSFGFIVEDEAWTGETRELRQVDLREISVVQAIPAYQQTEISLRNKPAELSFWESGDVRGMWLETCR